MTKRTHRITAPGQPEVNPQDLAEIGVDELRQGSHVDYIRLSGTSLATHKLDELVVQESEWSVVDLSETNLGKARFTDTRLSEISATHMSAPKSEFRNCEIVRSRLGFADLTKADVRRVRFTGCKIGFLSLSGAQIADVVFEGCAIEEIDFTDATVKRAAFTDSQIDSIHLGIESAQDFDLRTANIGVLQGVRSLRGIIMNEYQIVQFAELFARRLGARIA